MIPNISDAESSFLLAKSEHDNWIKEFLFQWYRPMIAMAISFMAKQQPDDYEIQMIASTMKGDTQW